MEPPVERYLDLLSDRLDDLLDTTLEGLYVVGSLALGGFVLGQSDIDVIAVTSSAPSDSLKRDVVDALSHPRLECPSRGLEFVLYDEPAVTIASRLGGFEINLNTGPGMTFGCSFDPESEPAHWFVVDRSIARSKGLRLVGRPREEVFAEIPASWILESLLEMLMWHRTHESSGANIVLNACRSWRFAEEGTWSSKVDGAQWAKRLGADPALIDAALAQRSGGTAGISAGEVDRLVRLVETAIAAALRKS